MSLKDLSTAPLDNHQPLSKEVEAFIEAIGDLLDDDRYTWASDTLIGIRQTVTDARVVTAGQRTAIRNIETSIREREDKKPWGRRYEGYSK